MTSNPRLLFRAAGLFNLAVALTFFFAAPQLATLLALQPAPAPTLYIRILAACIALFGWGYWIIGDDPVRFRPFIIQGMVGKLSVVTLIMMAVAMGQASRGFAALALGDMIFGFLFAIHLARTRAWRGLRM